MKSKEINERLLPGSIYHIYNRAVGDEFLFRSDESYLYFIKKLKRFIVPLARIFAYCLIPNHFHLLIKIRDKNDLKKALPTKYEDNLPKGINQAFSNFFNSYAVSINRTYKRMGKLFMLPYKRILVVDDEYFLALVNYIHRNPIHHGYTDIYDKWPYTSYNDYTNDIESFIDKDYVLELFGGVDNFIRFHLQDGNIDLVDLTGQS